MTDPTTKSTASRFLAVTQMMESLANLDITRASGADVQQLAQAAAMLLRDGCDVMDVLGGGFGRGSDESKIKRSQLSAAPTPFNVGAAEAWDLLMLATRTTPVAH